MDFQPERLGMEQACLLDFIRFKLVVLASCQLFYFLRKGDERMFVFIT